ncbi:MAG TPA: hypothetical protein VEJ68_03530, partial [Candidatus Bathyarchaeia archaeon]|nr:hypothetical protein [Candidatus Bathyarchaeia archaeon]
NSNYTRITMISYGNAKLIVTLNQDISKNNGDIYGNHPNVPYIPHIYSSDSSNLSEQTSRKINIEWGTPNNFTLALTNVGNETVTITHPFYGVLGMVVNFENGTSILRDRIVDMPVTTMMEMPEFSASELKQGQSLMQYSSLYWPTNINPNYGYTVPYFSNAIVMSGNYTISSYARFLGDVNGTCSMVYLWSKPIDLIITSPEQNSIIPHNVKKFYQSNANKTDWDYEHQFLRYLLDTKNLNMLKFHQTDNILTPPWLKNTYQWWLGGQISDNEFIGAIQYLMDHKIITSSSPGPETGIERKNLAINLATNSYFFKQYARGYNYTFQAGGNDCEVFPKSNDTSYSSLPDCMAKYDWLQFDLYQGAIDTGYNEKQVLRVTEDSALTKVLNVTESSPMWNGSVISLNTTTQEQNTASTCNQGYTYDDNYKQCIPLRVAEQSYCKEGYRYDTYLNQCLPIFEASSR